MAYSLEKLQKKAIELLEDRGVTLKDIGQIVLELQKKYIPDLSLEECTYHVEKILRKREIIHAVLTGIALDKLAEQKLLPEPLQQIIESDEPLYGIDEILSLSIVNVYGSIGFTNYGYLDKEKFGIIKELNNSHGGKVNTFLDDIVAAIAASAASRIAHNNEDVNDKLEEIK
ncbi:phosphatidylglycerophosphatase A [Aeribacillus composti]|uniref:Phosphatidylglycerophosphatase A n=1 Tax=Aeribacillus composti TaxID=1868734 RepID=A0ABY9WFG1_9BACI|nr:phosphatidylglycerophosphatase A [Aeribacillus composti]WNF34620.1 phosphatidylglycerophosphatase A [Aeribacillus composti]